MTDIVPIESVDAFVATLRARLALDGSVTAESRLLDDLGIESVAMFELLILLEEAAGRDLPDELIANLVTVGDAYDVYTDLVAQAASSRAT